MPLGDSILPFVGTVTAALPQVLNIASMNRQTTSGAGVRKLRRLQGFAAGCRGIMLGFTLIELMIVVAIVAILGALGGPAFTDMLRNNRLSAAASALQVSLSLARSEAVRRGADARVSVAANTTAGVWTNGWTVFIDGTTNANGGVGPVADTTTSTPVTRVEVVAAPSGPISTGQTGSLNYFTYNGQGRLITSSGASGANRSFWFFDGTSEKYCLILSITGRVRVARAASAASCPTDS